MSFTLQLYRLLQPKAYRTDNLAVTCRIEQNGLGTLAGLLSCGGKWGDSAWEVNRRKHGEDQNKDIRKRWQLAPKPKSICSPFTISQKGFLERTVINSTFIRLNSELTEAEKYWIPE